MTTYHRKGIDGIGWCPHAHNTVVSAVACIASAGDYIVAQEDGAFRALNKQEEADYKYAVHGGTVDRCIAAFEGWRKKRFT